jgi:hypothetical protein
VLVGNGGDRFGYQAEAGDLDGDGEIDLVVAAPHEVGGNALYVFFGQHGLNGQQLDPANADVAIQGPQYAETGWSLAIGDVVGDETADLIVGSPVEGGNDGSVLVFEGPLSPASYATTDATLIVRGHRGGYAGWSVAAGDFDGDGKAELAIGACNDGPNGRGAAYLLDVDKTAPTDTSQATATFEGAGLTGCSLANGGDFNGDGYEELLIGSHGAALTTGFDFGGMASIVYGRPTFDPSYDLVAGDPVTMDIAHITAEAKGENVGYSLARAGDVNLDGYDDILIGAPAFRCDACILPDRRGGVYLVLGTPDSGPGGGTDRGLHGSSVAIDVADVMWEAAGNNDRTGISVSAAGYTGKIYSRYTAPYIAANFFSYGDVLMFGTAADFAYAIPYDHKPRLGLVPKFLCYWDPELGGVCELNRDDVPKARHIRRDLGTLNWGGHRFVGDVGSAFGLEVLGTGDLNGDGGGDLLFGAPAQVDYEDPAGDGEAFAFEGQ